MRPLDFLIIGAQKAATTSLHAYLSSHPAIYMPRAKEVPFFSNDERFNKGWAWYVENFFSEGGGTHATLWGKATPHYMIDRRVPARIVQLMPQIKLIAILRNPIQRAFSHYEMLARHGQEKRTFEEAIKQIRTPSLLAETRDAPYAWQKESNGYLVWGEYGRILENYRRYFSSEQMLILFTDDLRDRPQATMDRILTFLGLPAGFRPPDLGKRYHTRMDHGLIANVQKILRQPGIGSLWRSIPLAHRTRIIAWCYHWGIRHLQSRPSTSPALRTDLVRFYQKDVRKLQTLLDAPLPWQEWQLDRGEPMATAQVQTVTAQEDDER